MPTYSYRCTECGTAFDVQQTFTDASLTVCPTCNGVLRKVFSPVGVSFTGSGFYRNDSRAKPAESKPAGSSESSDKAKSADLKPADSKPAESKPTSATKDAKASKPAGQTGAKSTASKPTSAG